MDTTTCVEWKRNNSMSGIDIVPQRKNFKTSVRLTEENDRLKREKSNVVGCERRCASTVNFFAQFRL